MGEADGGDDARSWCGDDASSWSVSSEQLIDCISFGSQSSAELSEASLEKQMEANRASVRAFLLTDGDRDIFASWARHMEASGEKTMPPYRIVKYPEFIEKAWGWDRLVPYDSSVDTRTYVAYLEKYYMHNSLEYVVTSDQKPEEWPLKNDAASRGQIANVNGLATVAKICLEAEQRLVFEWKNHVRSQMGVITMMTLSNLIQERANSIIISGEFSDTSAAALVCFVKEAYLICEMLRRGAHPDDYFIKQSSQIRLCALSLMNCKEQQAVAAAAAMVGVAKEAKMMCAWMKNEDMLLDSYNISDELEDGQEIRYRTLDFIVTILEESSVSSFTAAVKSDNGVSATASETAKSTRCHSLERVNSQDRNKITDSVKTKKKKKTESQVTKHVAVTQKSDKTHRRKSRKAKDREEKKKIESQRTKDLAVAHKRDKTRKRKSREAED